MSRSYKDGVGGHLRREIAGDELGGYGSIVWKPHAKRWAKRRCARAARRNNKPNIRCPELIYPYLNVTYRDFGGPQGSYIQFDWSEEYDWEEFYDDHSDNWHFYEMLMEEEDWDEPDFDYIYDPWDDYDYGYEDYDY